MVHWWGKNQVAEKCRSAILTTYETDLRKAAIILVIIGDGFSRLSAFKEKRQWHGFVILLENCCQSKKSYI